MVRLFGYTNIEVIEMKEYLKMSDVYDLPLVVVDSTSVTDVDDYPVSDFDHDYHAEYAIEAINSHDELVDSLQSVTNERDELAKEVARLQAKFDDAFIWAFNAGCDADNEIERGYALDILKSYKEAKGL